MVLEMSWNFLGLKIVLEDGVLVVLLGLFLNFMWLVFYNVMVIIKLHLRAFTVIIM